MTLVVTHTTVTGAAADPTALVDGPAWDANHTLTGAASPVQGGTGVANDAASTLTITGSFGTTFTVTAATSVTLPTTGTLATLAGTEELTNKTLNASVAKGTWTASGTWTIPAVTLGGTVSGGGNQLNNVIIGTSTPLAGSFTTLSASTSLTSPLIIGGSGAASTLTLESTSGAGTTDAIILKTASQSERMRVLTGGQVGIGTSAPVTNSLLTVSNNATAPPDPGAATQLQLVGADGGNNNFGFYGFGGQIAMAFVRANNTNASKTALAANDVIGIFGFAGYHSGGAYTINRARVVGYASEAWTSSAQGTYLDIETTATGGTTRATAIRIHNSGSVSVGTGFATDPGADNLKVSGALLTKTASTFTGTSGTVAATDSAAIFNASGTFTATLPTATAGRWLYVKNIAAQTVNSASSNVVPVAGGAASTALLTATAGKWAILQANGTNWEIFASN